MADEITNAYEPAAANSPGVPTGKVVRRGVVAVLAGLTCAVAPLVAALPTASASTPQVAKPQPAICKYLNDQAGSQTFASELGKDIKDKNFNAFQALLLSLVDGVEKMSTSRAVRSTPAAVQAAIRTVAHSDLTVKSEIEKSTTISDLERILTAMGNAPGVHSAENVINKYANQECEG
jgi:hypothetical protein